MAQHVDEWVKADPWLLACRKGDLSVIRSDYKKTSCPKEEVIYGSQRNLYEGFQQACQGGHADVVRELIKFGANNLDEGMIYAIRGRHSTVVRELIQHSAVQDNLWSLFLHYALETKQFDIVQMFYSTGTDAFKKSFVTFSHQLNTIDDFWIDCMVNLLDWDSPELQTNSIDSIEVKRRLTERHACQKMILDLWEHSVPAKILARFI